jgi:hypothetical protein
MAPQREGGSGICFNRDEDEDSFLADIPDMVDQD